MDYSKLTKQEIIEGIKNESIKLSKLSKKFKDDKDIVLNALSQNEVALSYASDRLKDDKEIVLKVCRKFGMFLYYASDRLKNDKELLEILKKEDVNHLSQSHKNWYEERLEFLANMKDKDLLEKTIFTNDKSSKKIKF